MMRRMPEMIFLLLAVLISCGASAAAQQDSDTRDEFWPEVDAFIHLKPKVRLFFLATVSRAKETREAFEGQVGAHVDLFVNKNIYFRTGYRHGFSLGDTDDPFSEQRIILEQTFRIPIPAGFLLSDRNRGDLRWVNGKFSTRYRNRLMLEREFNIRERSYTPYVSGELYYDTRFDTWNRNRYAFGIQWSLRKRGPLSHLISPSKNIVFDFYYMRQNDSRSQPNHVNAFGFVTNLYF
jgi:Protein of unknown function (DUF2490)